VLETIKKHWPEYLIELASLGMFMVSACAFAALLGHPRSPAHEWVGDGVAQRVVMGLAMGLTAIALIYSPWGQRSGAHMNPAVTLAFWHLGKVQAWDAVFYTLSQFAGGLLGVFIARAFLDPWLLDPAVNYAVTIPGRYGPSGAFVGETVISFVLMATVLVVSNTPSHARYTRLLAGILIGLYIIFEAPISGMSMNPARTFGSAFSAGVWTHLWIYFTAPLLGMIVAAEGYIRLCGAGSVLCSKLHHGKAHRCIFNCGYCHHSGARLSSGGGRS
jgi:aquaporin Z